ncbi:hypothetical protein HR060_02345 [Catenovulum sp. SM1970]|uniref:hypothetical protein n=1 Tax=Marinifaba aquimaris TaxID=2741323 RepID=UPI001573E2AC|nr:hypothetical protein [Marinifaba aquimaris]NTS75696.1 hypothetical protein [Marinifaba aquimaris]
MSLKLSAFQKKELKALFQDDGVDFDFLFWQIELNMKDIVIPTSKKVKAKETVRALQEIERASKAIQNALSMLDEKQKYKVSYSILNPVLGNDLTNTMDYFQNADVTKMFKSLEEHCYFYHNYTQGRYGSGVWDEVIDAICLSWPVEIATEKNITLNSRLVQFFSIIIEEVSYEKIQKFIKRSSWYKQHFVDNRSWMEKL